MGPAFSDFSRFSLAAVCSITIISDFHLDMLTSRAGHFPSILVIRNSCSLGCVLCHWPEILGSGVYVKTSCRSFSFSLGVHGDQHSLRIETWLRTMQVADVSAQAPSTYACQGLWKLLYQAPSLAPSHTPALVFVNSKASVSPSKTDPEPPCVSHVDRADYSSLPALYPG